ncbi:FAD binding domain-containing protein [Salipiger mucosus]|uniref:Xanthine dehydrogenase, FAD binding protein subunit n=1 Tax=Salipiger mucosus DSM 16094 TaxID=1123237 RepID=S9QBD0_9RHOB|nr:xanthine dehydrogenase family protein subunit M [Salipiger mucosus]EPX78711.1 Xanthine dehydrogenase, FAD binding protein subunit [Salipiger mucosus DSM 16094]
MTLHRPESLPDALSLLGASDAVVLAGGTDVYPGLRDGPAPDCMVDVSGLPELRGISKGAGRWRIGAATTWTEVLRADLPPVFDGLKAAAREVGSVQIQNTGTVAGNLCNASPAADGVPPLLTLDATVEIAGPQGTRHLPLADFLKGPRRTALQPGELVSAVHVPEAQGGAAFLKLGARAYLVISIAMVAAVTEVRAGRIERAAVAVGACTPVARRLQDLEATLCGRPASDLPEIVSQYPFAELTPIDDVRASAGYRQDAVRTLVARALARSMEVDHVA